MATNVAIYGVDTHRRVDSIDALLHGPRPRTRRTMTAPTTIASNGRARTTNTLTVSKTTSYHTGLRLGAR